MSCWSSAPATLGRTVNAVINPTINPAEPTVKNKIRARNPVMALALPATKG
jgi:hypothetical protein